MVGDNIYNDHRTGGKSTTSCCTQNKLWMPHDVVYTDHGQGADSFNLTKNLTSIDWETRHIAARGIKEQGT
jgi:hypothetical protein